MRQFSWRSVAVITSSISAVAAATSAAELLGGIGAVAVRLGHQRGDALRRTPARSIGSTMGSSFRTRSTDRTGAGAPKGEDPRLSNTRSSVNRRPRISSRTRSTGGACRVPSRASA